MKKFMEFIKKPKNLYLSIMVMFVLVMGLTSISFSYYIEDSTNGKQLMKVNKIDTFIQSDDLKSNEIVVDANSSKTITINVISNNSFTSIYKLFHTNESITVTSNKPILDSIDSMYVQTYELTFTNNTNENQMTKLGIKNGYKNTEIEIEGIEIK